MYWSSAILGPGIVAKQQARVAAVILTIGADRFTRADLAAVRCFNFNAAANLSALLATFRVVNAEDLFDRIAPRDLLAVPLLGAVSLAVLGAAFEKKKIGGVKPLEAWMMRHRKGLVTFATVKRAAAADAQALADEKKTITRRKTSRLRLAQRQRIERLTRRRVAS